MINKKYTCLLPVRVISVISKYVHSSHSISILHTVQQRPIQSRHQRRSMPQAAVRAVANRCQECDALFINDNQSLSRRGRHGRCFGCNILFGTVKQTGEDIQDVRRWLCHGELPVGEWAKLVNNDREIRKVRAMANDMRTRFRRSEHADPQHKEGLPTANEIKELVADSGLRCAVTGWLCHHSSSEGLRSWTLTLDHIVPVSIPSPPGQNPWSTQNIQVMCYLLNQIKGNHQDGELRRWFRVWKTHHM